MWTSITISALLMTGIAATEVPRQEAMPAVAQDDLLCADTTAELQAKSAPKAACNATADCWDGSQVNCSAAGPKVSCHAVDSDCPGKRGYAECDGNRVWCPPCPDPYCNCRILPSGQWGVWEGGSCVLKICLIPVE